MTTASPAAVIDAPAVRLRRRPRQPLAAQLLLWAWLAFFFGGMGVFVYWMIEDVHPVTGQPRLLTGGVVTMIVVFLSWSLLAVRARMLQRLDRKVQAARGAVCLNCRQVLTQEGQEGTCPKCGEAFTLPHVRDVWKKHTP